MKEIKLSQQGKNKDKYVALVSDAVFEYLNQFKWSVEKRSNTFYARRRIKTLSGKAKFIYMHREIMLTNELEECDHIDRNGLNNQNDNLRNCSHTQNNMNRMPRGKSKYKGVSFKRNKPTARIFFNGKTIYLGCFQSEELAAIAYDNKAKELFGEFANLNFK